MRQYFHFLYSSAFVLFALISTSLFGNTIATDSLKQDYGKVVYVSLIVRHGDRNPQITFPSDPYRTYPWRGGLGSLTDDGKRKLVELGEWFKLRYRDVIDENYSSKQIRVDSSGIDRAIISGQCFLYGFYPTTNSNRWLGTEKWQPIPIHTIPRNHDNIIANLKSCDRYKRLVDETYLPIYKQYEHVIRYIENKTGINFKNVHIGRIFHILSQLEDTLQIYSEQNFTIPSWTLNVSPEPLETILSKTQRDSSFSAERSRFATGPLIKSIISDMRHKIYDENFEQVLHLYSGHDITLRRCMVGLRVYDGGKLPYGSALIIELRRKENATYYVTVFFKNESFGSPHLLEIPACVGLNCSFQRFENLTRSIIPSDWEEECKISSGSLFLHSSYMLVVLLISLSSNFYTIWQTLY